jgi:hypothetical protein
MGREALEQSPEGLSKHQIIRLFHGHVNGDRIDAALEQLMLIDAASCHSELTGGRPSTLWSATADEEQEQEENQALEAGGGEPVADEEGLYRLWRTFIWQKGGNDRPAV